MKKLTRFPDTIFVFVNRDDDDDPFLVACEHPDDSTEIDHGTPVATYTLAGVADMNVERKLVPRASNNKRRR